MVTQLAAGNAEPTPAISYSHRFYRRRSNEMRPLRLEGPVVHIHDDFVERIISERVVGAGRTFRILEREIEIAPGRITKWEVLDKGGDSVAMIAVDDDGFVYLVEEYFGATNERTYCMPKGRIDADEDPAAAALRELQEEVGMTGTPQLLSVLSVSPGYLAQRTSLFLVTGLRVARRPGDEAHYLRVVRLTLDEALTRCFSGEISEARTVAGLCLAAVRLGPVPPGPVR